MRNSIARRHDPSLTIFAIQREQLREHLFLTNDLVRVQIRERTHKVAVNEMPLNGVKTHGIVVLAVLIREAILRQGCHLSAKEIAGIIESGGLALPGLSWKYPTENGVHKAVQMVRDALERAGRNRGIIETGKNHQGYRLSTPAVNLTLSINGKDLVARPEAGG